MASTIKVTNINTPDGTGSITADRPLAGDGNALVGISPRNYIIDGDFTQWPGGTSATTTVNGSYGLPALWDNHNGGTGTGTWERSTDVPTVAQSGHQSAYSMLIKCTGTDASVAAGASYGFRYYVTGSDFAHISQQQVTLSFWAKTAAANSGDTYSFSFRNSANDRTYVHDFSPTSSWTKFTHTFTLDTSGTWLYTEADKGLLINLGLAVGSNFQDSAETWQAGLGMGTSSTSNFTDNTGNEFYISQFGLYLGGSAPTFTSPPISTVKDQIDYYVQRYDFDSVSDEIVATGHLWTTTDTHGVGALRREMRTAGTATITSGGSAWQINYDSSHTNMSASLSIVSIGKNTFKFSGAQSAVGVQGENVIIKRQGTGTASYMLDARH